MSESGKPQPYTAEEFCSTSRASVDLRRVRETIAERDDLREALFGLRDTDDEGGDDNRLAGPCWCPGWVGTRRGGHIDSCLQARKAIGAEP